MFRKLDETIFPGLDEIWNVLPHLGNLFLQYFSLYRRVELKPDQRPKEACETVKLAVYRDGKPWLTSHSRESFLPTLNLDDVRYTFPGFKIRKINVPPKGLSIHECIDKKRNYLSNKVKTFLKDHTFVLKIAALAEKQLSDPSEYVHYFWHNAHSRNDMVSNGPHRITVMIEKKTESLISGLDYDHGHELFWKSLIPNDSVHYKALSMLATWDEWWHTIYHQQNTKISFNMKATWRECCRDLNKVFSAVNAEKKDSDQTGE